MKASASRPPGGECDIVGSAAEWLELANVVESGGGTVSLVVGNPQPYDLSLAEVRVALGAGLVRVSVDEQANSLTIEGGTESLGLLAVNLRVVSEQPAIGEEEDWQVAYHTHVDWFPDHYYLAEESVGVVASRSLEERQP